MRFPFCAAFFALSAAFAATQAAAVDPSPPLAPGTVAAEQAPAQVARPMLWKVTGPGLGKPSYLFGTMHFLDRRLSRLHPLVEQAFAGADSVHTEVALTPRGQAEAEVVKYRADDRTFSEVAGPELVEAVRKRLSPYHPAAGKLEGMKTWAVAMALRESVSGPRVVRVVNGVQGAKPAHHEGAVSATPSPVAQGTGGGHAQVAPLKPLDFMLWDKAKRAGKRTGGLETAQAHFADALDGLGEDEQIRFLKAALALPPSDPAVTRACVERYVAAYLQGDMEAAMAVPFLAELGDSQDAEVVRAALKKAYLGERNAGIAASIVAEFKAHPDQSHFFAAGTAHFAGPGSVLELLRKAGYAVERVEK